MSNHWKDIARTILEVMEERGGYEGEIFEAISEHSLMHFQERRGLPIMNLPEYTPKRPFRCTVEYHGEFLPFTDLEALVAFCWGRVMRDMTFWFGECPVMGLDEYVIALPEISYLRELLPMAQVLGESYRDLLPAKIGIRFAYKDVAYFMQVGLDNDDRLVPHESIVDFILREGTRPGDWWYFHQTEGNFHLFYKIWGQKSLTELWLESSHIETP